MEINKEELVFAPANRRHLDESELRDAFASVHEDTPIWIAIRQLFLQELQNMIMATGARASSDPGDLAASAGAMEEIADFYGRLLDRFEDAHAIGPRE